jgi:hypothetical protein
MKLCQKAFAGYAAQRSAVLAGRIPRKTGNGRVRGAGKTMEPIYRTDGEWVAVYYEGNIFNIDGEWIGFVVGREVFDTGGLYLGFLSDDRRLLRKRSRPIDKPHLEPPARPPRPKIPATMPLVALLASLPYQIIDLFEEYPEKLTYVSETRPDME